MATGGLPTQPFFDIPAATAFTAENAPFSAICLGNLRQDLETYRDAIMRSGDPFGARASEDAIVKVIADAVRALLLHVRWENRLAFLEQAPAALAKTVMQLEVESEKRAYAAERKLLTEPSIPAILPPVKSQLDNLLAGLNRLTNETGKKTELADYLGAPLASVSRWLSGEREPGGETTLQMLRWVQEQERQPNTLGSAMNIAKGKTQVSKSSNEKQTQVRKK